VVVTIALTPPTPPDGSTVNTTTVEFGYSITDTALGICDIEFSFDGIDFFSIKQGEFNQDLCRCDFFPADGTFTLELFHGTFLLHFRAVDCFGNIGPEATLNLIVDVFTNISFNPVPPSIVNNSTLFIQGIRETNATVTVGLVDGPLFPVTLPTPTTWEATVILLEGSNTIIATATDAESNEASATAVVVLDTIAPAVPVVTQVDSADLEYLENEQPPLFTNEPNQTLIGDKETNTSILINGTEVLPLDATDTFSIPIVLVEGLNTFNVTAKDAADNESDATVVTITLDTVPPGSPSILINDGTSFTLVRDVTLTLSATDAVEVKVSENPNFSNAEFISFSDPLLLPFELSRGGGTKTVFAVFRDEVGNETVPVFDDIILPSTISEEVDRADTMTIQELLADPEDEYLIRLQDNRDGTFSIEIYLDLVAALTGGPTNRLASATATSPGVQTLTLVPDIGGPTGTISVTLFEGAEVIVYRFRTDVFDAAEGELGLPIVYSTIEGDEAFEAQTLVPIYCASAFGRILEFGVDGDPAKIRISKAFNLEDEDTAILESGEVFEITDTDGSLFPIVGAQFDYPLLTVPAKVLSLTEEDDAYLITVDKDIPRFDATFGYEMLFSKKRELVTDYRITKEGRVEFLNESGLASGNVRVTYQAPQFITSGPSAEFKPIPATTGASVKLTVVPTNNLILLSDLDRVCIRFFHSLEDLDLIAPDSIQVTVNDVFMATIASFTVASSNDRAEIREFCANKIDLFPVGSGPYGEDAYGPDNPVINKVEIAFTSASNVTYTDEIQVIAESSVVSSKCRVIVNGDEVFMGTEPVENNRSDSYELRVQNGLVDVFCNDECVHTEIVDLDGATAIFGAGARVAGDRLDAAFSQFTTIQYLSTSPSPVALAGRFVAIEATLRESSRPLLRSFALDFDSDRSETPERTFIPDALVDEFFDTATVAIIGMGQREETLVSQGLGEEDEGQPVDFNVSNDPDGRHFQVTSFPIVGGTLKVFLFHEGTEIQLSEDIDFHVDLTTGRIVLFHPIALNDKLRVEYTSGADVNVPELFTELEPLTNKFGAPSPENTLSLGAQLAFQNGAKRVLVVQALDPVLDPGWTEAYEALVKEEAYFVVPLPPTDYSLIAERGLNHVETSSNTKNRRERVLILGESADLTADDLDLFRNTFRVSFIQPGSAIFSIIEGEGTTLEGMFLAAAYAGRFSSLNLIALPMTGKDLIGFSLDDTVRITNIELEQKAKNGITFIRKLASGGRVYRSVTTSNSRLSVEQEQSITRIRDFLAINIRRILDDRFVGKPIVEGLTDIIKTVTESFLRSQQDNGVITIFSGVRAGVDSVEPRQINVSFDVRPVFPLNNLVVTVNVVTRI
jgi:hypothetical protein